MFKQTLLIALIGANTLTHASLPSDNIQRCLDVRRLVDFTTREKLAAKEPGVMRYRFHKVDPSDILLNNPVGNMNEVINALNNQIENCYKKQGEYQTIKIGDNQYTRQEWCQDANRKMLTLAKAAHGDFNKYLASIKTEFDWYKSDGWPDNQSGYKKGDFQFTAYYAPAPVEAHRKQKGDFCFSNILYFPSKHIIKLIDPRGSFTNKGIYGHYLYDYAKIMHCLHSRYDFIVNDKFILNEFGQDNFYFEVPNLPIITEMEEIYINKLIDRNIDIEFIYLIEASLFLSMASLHYENEQRQKVMYLIGVRLLNQILEGKYAYMY